MRVSPAWQPGPGSAVSPSLPASRDRGVFDAGTYLIWISPPRLGVQVVLPAPNQKNAGFVSMDPRGPADSEIQQEK